MRRRYQLALPALALFISGPSSAQDDAATSLRYDWQAGSVLRYEINNSMVGTLKVSVGKEVPVVTEVPLDYRIEMAVSVTCRKVDSRRRCHGEFAIARIKIVERQGGSVAEFDTRAPEKIEGKALEPLFQELLRLIDNPLVFTLTERGQVNFTALAREKLAKIGGPLDPTQLRVELERIFPELPEEPIALGASWTTSRTIDMPTLGDVTLKTRSMLASTRDDRLQIDLTFTPEFGTTPPPAIPTVAAPLRVKKATGSQTHEASTRILISHSSQFDVSMKLAEEDLKLAGNLRLESSVKRAK